MLANVDTLAPTDVDLSSGPKIKTYLHSIGVDPRGVVIQRGARNYAGPNCPGIAWNCTTSSKVVQISSRATDDDDDDDGENGFVCRPAAYGSNMATNTCIVVQTNENGNNRATCRQSSHANPVTLTCDITQSNVSGDNFATIDLKAKQVGGATQGAELIASLDQSNASGDNRAGVTETISQTTSAFNMLATPSQEQTADFVADPIDQRTDTGSNVLQISQALTQDGRASGSASISQVQEGNHQGQVEQQVFGEGAGSLLSGAVGYRLDDDDDDDDENGEFSRANVTQTERQTLKGPGFQDQSGPMNCCGAGSQTGSPKETRFTLHQSSTEKASQFDEGTADQFQFLHGDCSTTGTCSLRQSATNEADSLKQHVSGTGIQELFTTCFAPGQCFPFDATGGD